MSHASGQPVSPGAGGTPGRRVQYAALPFRVRRDGEVQIRLITSRETRRWVIPKGWPMKGISPPKAAARECYEEAGLLGEIAREPFGMYTYEKRLGARSVLCDVLVFPLKVKRHLQKWPERFQRYGFWFSIDSAAAAVQEEDLGLLIRAFGDVVARNRTAEAALKEKAGKVKEEKVKEQKGKAAKGASRKVEAPPPSEAAPATSETAIPAVSPLRAKAKKREATEQARGSDSGVAKLKDPRGKRGATRRLGARSLPEADAVAAPAKAKSGKAKVKGRALPVVPAGSGAPAAGKKMAAKKKSSGKAGAPPPSAVSEIAEADGAAAKPARKSRANPPRRK